MKLGKALATGVAEERPVADEADEVEVVDAGDEVVEVEAEAGEEVSVR
ncbi:hypothetical protein [Streptomyces sp. YIM S03343]